MKNKVFLKRLVLAGVLVAFGAVSLIAGPAFAVEVDPALLASTDMSSTTAIANIKLVGVLMIGISLAALGIAVARRMLR